MPLVKFFVQLFRGVGCLAHSKPVLSLFLDCRMRFLNLVWFPFSVLKRFRVVERFQRDFVMYVVVVRVVLCVDDFPVVYMVDESRIC